jgi:hypothetical protein
MPITATKVTYVITLETEEKHTSKFMYGPPTKIKKIINLLAIDKADAREQAKKRIKEIAGSQKMKITKVAKA